ncbi:hypothetical protein BK411_13555, partial [Vibrio splendidus]
THIRTGQGSVESIILALIEGYFLLNRSTSISGFIEAETIEPVIQKGHYVVGTYQDRKLYVLLFGGEPKHHQIKGLEQDGKNNVFGLF